MEGSGHDSQEELPGKRVVRSLLRFYKWHVLATKKENRGREEMYCFPRLKDLPTPNFAFRLENETAASERRRSKKGKEGGTKQIYLNMVRQEGGLFVLKSFSPSVARARDNR